MKRFSISIIYISILVLSGSCKKSIPADLSASAFIPHPLKVEASGSSFQLNKINFIEVSDLKELGEVAEYLKAQLTFHTGLEFVIKENENPGGNGLFLGLGQLEGGSSAYQLTINENNIHLLGSEAVGVFYGIQSLLQALELNHESERWIVPAGMINDYPKYEYRGVMLDVARHFFEVDDVKRLIDLMAVYKLNHLHLHLSDDQGWRIEIKSWPKLTEIGGSTEVGGGQGGFYTQEQYKDIVSYAKDRFITIIPEIDMPGHTNAALASYPELNCDGKARELYTGTEVGFSTLCTRNELTYQFVDDVIRELADITEGPYIHIGGDESHVTSHDDYVYFINRTKEIVKAHAKVMIGWDEIAHAGIDGDDIVQYWAKDENASLAVQKGAKVLMSPSKRAYLDMQYDSTTHLGLHWAAYIEVDDAYNWKPENLVEGIKKENIIGVESPLWTETITNISEMEYMIFPRLAGHAEIAWSPDEYLVWEEYKDRLSRHSLIFERLGINYYRSPKVLWLKE